METEQLVDLKRAFSSPPSQTALFQIMLLGRWRHQS